MFADDIVLLSESPEDLQTLLDILFEFGKTFHISFGIKKCEVVFQSTDYSQPNTMDISDEDDEKLAGLPDDTLPVPKFRLGNRGLEIRKGYQYLGIKEQLDDNYETFFKQKKRNVMGQISKVQRAKRRKGGLYPHECRKLYLNLVRPLIEFGVTTVPFSKQKMWE